MKKEKHDIFNHEFLPHIDALYNFGYRLTLNEDDTKDLIQETYLKAYRFIKSFQQGTNAKTWLFFILKNSFINAYRKKKKEPQKIDYQDVENYSHFDVEEGHIVTDLQIESLQNMVGDEVSNALNTLHVDSRIIIILCDLEDFQYDEIAKILDIPIGTVRSRLHRARNLLKQKLYDYAKKMGYQKN